MKPSPGSKPVNFLQVSTKTHLRSVSIKYVKAMKTLIVDDELVSRKKMQKIMDSLGECEAVESGNKAIAAFQRALENGMPFDLVTLDIAMPEMDGKETLYALREIERKRKIPEENRSKILIVTSYSDEDTVLACIRAECDGYIVKPFNREVIVEKLEKLGMGKTFSLAGKAKIEVTAQENDPAETKSSIIEEIISQFKGGQIDLPSPPQIGVKFNEMVNKSANIEEIADFLKQDVAVSFKLISIANSVYYRGVSEYKTVMQAINRLGLNTTGQYVNVISNRSLYAATSKEFKIFLDRLWEHSLCCAYASQSVSEFLELELPDDVFTIGLLHDIGKLVLLYIYCELEKKCKISAEIDREDLLRDLEAYHGKFGAAVLTRWNFPSGYADAAKYHDNLGDADPVSKELLVVHFANLLVKEMGYGLEQQPVVDVQNSESAILLRLNSEATGAIKDQVKKCMESLKGYFT
ncbi:MAG TPA: HDOD domain-containing protein [Desulfatiglandales bacterium]|nr:HDOD domain-containing protein [Desulfatiglandales bacterium]